MNVPLQHILYPIHFKYKSNMRIFYLFLLFQFISCITILGQDSTAVNTEKNRFYGVNEYNLNYKKLIIPTVFMGYGVASLKVNLVGKLNFSTQYEIDEHIPEDFHLDNYTQYAPAAIVYGLNLIGVKEKHNFKDRSIIFITSQLLVGAAVTPLKHIVKETRPDGSNNLSFPSGHTATAFSNAQFMFREYKDTTFWLSISGYPLAVYTGIYRMLNNKHWVGDVVGGAGIGILSTEISYWLYPKINLLFTKKNDKNETVILPYYQNKLLGVLITKKL